MQPPDRDGQYLGKNEQCGAEMSGCLHESKNHGTSLMPEMVDIK